MNKINRQKPCDYEVS